MKTNLFLFRSRFVKILLIIIIFLVTMNGREAYAANRYVDNDAPCVGTACDGTTWEKAWKSFSAIRLSSGDILYISGGITSQSYREQLTVNVAATVRPGGAESSPLPEHSGTVVISSPTAYGIHIASNNATVNGLDKSGNRKILVQGPNSSRGVFADSRTGIVARGIEITDQADGIWFINCEGEIDNVYVHQMSLQYGNSGMFIGRSIDYRPDLVSVHDSVIEVPIIGYNNGTGADGIQASCCTTLYNNKITAVPSAYTGGQHSDGVQALGSYMKAWNNIVTGFPNWGFGWGFCMDTCYAHNNYFYNTANCLLVGNRAPGNLNNIRFENNTIVDCLGNGDAIQIGMLTTSSTAVNVSVRNNIIINCTNAINAWAGNYNCGTDVIIDYNITVAGSRGNTMVNCDGVPYEQPTYHSHTRPNFVNYVQYGGPTNDMRLNSTDTIAKDRGTNLSTHFTIDKDGVSRPQGSAWDIGAYEYTTTESRPRPPQNLRVISP